MRWLLIAAASLSAFQGVPTGTTLPRQPVRLEVSSSPELVRVMRGQPFRYRVCVRNVDERATYIHRLQLSFNDPVPFALDGSAAPSNYAFIDRMFLHSDARDYLRLEPGDETCADREFQQRRWQMKPGVYRVRFGLFQVAAFWRRARELEIDVWDREPRKEWPEAEFFLEIVPQD